VETQQSAGGFFNFMKVGQDTQKKITSIRRKAGQMPLSQRISLMESLDRLARSCESTKGISSPRAQEADFFAVTMLYANVARTREQLQQKKQKLYAELESLKVESLKVETMGMEKHSMQGVAPFFHEAITPVHSDLHSSSHPTSFLLSPRHHSSTPPPHVTKTLRASTGKRQREALFIHDQALKASKLSASKHFGSEPDFDLLPPSVWNAVQV
jgi:hypothetical protein